jgi:hypothetical protein
MVRSLCALAVLLVTSGCDSISTAPEPPVRYAVEVSGETFVVEVTTADQVDQMEARLASGEEGVISGELAAGDAGYNEEWSWHMVPATVHAADVAIEVCDGRPSMVEDDLEYWLDTVERFCPWGATVVERLP